MLQLKNQTPFAAKLMLLPDLDGVDTLFTVLKGSFALTDPLTVADEQIPIAVADEYYGEPGVSSIRVASDVSLLKPGTDVLLQGSAMTPGGSPAWQSDVSVTAGPVTKTVRVFGDRVWDTGGMAWVQPFVRMPLVWERAYGGTRPTPNGAHADARNPAGVGYRTSAVEAPIVGSPLPNVEDPAALLTGPKDRPAPAGFAPVAPNWEPRKSFAGTYDEKWQAGRAPYLPADFDPRFLQLAPAGLVTPQPLRGGEMIELQGVTPSGQMRFTLPVLRLNVAHRVEAQLVEQTARIDTLLLLPDENRVVIVWRSALRCDKKALKIKEVRTTVIRS